MAAAPDRRLIVAGAVVVPLLWFGGDWWVSGSQWNGTSEAQVYRDAIASRVGRALSRRLAGDRAGVGGGGCRPGDRMAPASGRCSSSPAPAPRGALVVAMSGVLPAAALSRFLIPTAVITCVLAGIGVVRAVRAVPAGPSRASPWPAWSCSRCRSPWPRVDELGEEAQQGIRARAALERDLDTAIERAGGAGLLMSCGRVAIDNSERGQRRSTGAGVEARPADAAEPARRLSATGGVMFARATAGGMTSAGQHPAATAQPLARTEHWAVCGRMSSRPT